MRIRFEWADTPLRSAIGGQREATFAESTTRSNAAGTADS
ncbi:Hypothetical protein PFCIRM134_00305 [Propionibacterium freudenreichii]|uniref:Uncharacterized protein n=1 Tax=Propionibacterium freudenreichii subsp. shermanii (strain ATCC 9614 / DSM 4902 / CIP 103027 / NCIMB 8099 / CIRM-BIA1) TaxID=754252 RepID=D7GE74_PROFC|nr:Hypothetical protein PFREUD_13170 [Propionibacterium freudenreichii subsp. shermanii CIRM-BIA1]CEH03332.1 Hypothetical protein PFCIRM134_00305 [Propionibacterium freudenreichii]